MEPSPSCSETVSVDDTSGRNACPMHLRITAVARLPYNEAVQYLNGTLHTQDANKSRARGGEGTRVKVWAMIDGEKVVFRSIVELAAAIGATGKALSNAKFSARRSGHTTAKVFGYTFGWEV